MGIPVPQRLNCIAVVPQGLEQAAVEELQELGGSGLKTLRRAVGFQADLASFYRAQRRARLPFRLLRQLGSFPCRSREDLYWGVQRCTDWEPWLKPQLSLRVDATGSAPGLNHSHYSALQVKNALVDWQQQRWGERSNVDLEQPDLSFHIHLGGGQATLSVDGSGESLHRRGYRPRMGLAPLKENLAAGLIRLTGWDGSVPLADPLCGSGTLLLEAACMALKRHSGLDRSFALEQWPDFEPTLWEQETAAAAAEASDRALPAIVGNEMDGSVLEDARANSIGAGLEQVIQWQQGDCRNFVPPEGCGVLVCNPPYGERIGQRDELEQLYSDLGAMVKERCSGWSLWLLSGNPELTGALKMKASRRIPVSNGGIDCRWLHYEIR